MAVLFLSLIVLLASCQAKYLHEPPCVSRFWSSLDERVGEEKHQSDHQTIDGQGFHEGQRQQQHTSEIISNLRLTGDAMR